MRTYINPFRYCASPSHEKLNSPLLTNTFTHFASPSFFFCITTAHPDTPSMPVISCANYIFDKCNPRDKFARTHVPLFASLLEDFNERCSEKSFLDEDPALSGWPPRPPTPEGWRSSKHQSTTSVRTRSSCDQPRTAHSTRTTTTMDVLQRPLRNVELDPDSLDFLNLQPPPSAVPSVGCLTTTDTVDTSRSYHPIQPQYRERHAVYYDRHEKAQDDDLFHDWDEDYSAIGGKIKPSELQTRSALTSSISLFCKPVDAIYADMESRMLYHNPKESVHFFPIPVQRTERERRSSESSRTVISRSSSRSTLRRITGRDRSKSDS
ncbi:hypothetical protein CONPUDRAFT_137629 [Coniophora puteana RWD-64-598 SS2]|uniref:Uncharacterized protein n=1 Tax=Coniophora puteana (strain RWD-64-598) TaxID=741705 RepID=A0A5M3MMY9_CONPW|nr:uncharacterized protein CONPUDRAFT_137629 [Coniophora puteana RWD-64-598 SS2]EIW80407.1 hypothetical protein CONPUDRAFT_137629 [Coniophora puteana RWD-64-598 SS2]